MRLRDWMACQAPPPDARRAHTRQGSGHLHRTPPAVRAGTATSRHRVSGPAARRPNHPAVVRRRPATTVDARPGVEHKSLSWLPDSQRRTWAKWRMTHAGGATNACSTTLINNAARDRRSSAPVTSVDVAAESPEVIWLSQYEPASPNSRKIAPRPRNRQLLNTDAQRGRGAKSEPHAARTSKK